MWFVPCARWGIIVLALSIFLSAWPAWANAPRAERIACPAPVEDLASCYAAKDASGAFLFAALPKNWNGDLIVLGHGGPGLDPPTAKGTEELLANRPIALRLGYGWVATSYRREGYGVAFAAADLDRARRFFIDGIAKPQHVFLHGESYGGLVAAKLLESGAKSRDGKPAFDGALLQSGAVAGALLLYEHRSDLRVVYQSYCNNLPRPGEAAYPLWTGVPADPAIGFAAIRAALEECTGISRFSFLRSREQRRNLKNILGVMGYPEDLLLRHLVAATLTLRDIATRITGGRSAFSNIGIRYKGSDDDDALNRGVARFAADPAAVAAMEADGVPNGHLPVPVISIHSINDPQLPVETQSVYRDIVSAAGRGDRLVQAFTDEPRHVGQSAPEIAAALEALRQWVASGTKPTPQSIAGECRAMQKLARGDCSYHPDFAPKPYNTRFYPRALSAH